MSADWRTVSLGECIEFDTGFPFKSAEYVDTPDAVRLLRGDNIGQGRVRWEGVKRWLRKDNPSLAAYELRENDLVLAMDRPWITAGLKFARVRKGDLPALLVQRVARLRPQEGVDADYLHSIVASPEFTQHIQNVTTGTAVPHISGKQIQEYKFKLPDLATQKAIGRLLMSLDDRITLLRETNATLEAIAQALFKSWFVDFDPVRAKMEGRAPEGMDEVTAALFPDGFEESELGLVPIGWHIDPVGHVVAGIYDGPHATPAESDKGPIFLGIKNLTGSGLNLDDVRHIHEDDWAQWTRRITPRHGDIVFSYEATLGFFALIPPDTRCCLGRRLALFRPNQENGFGHFWFHQFVSASFQRLLNKHTIQGATVNRIPLKEFPSFSVMNPADALKAVFDDRVAPLWAKIQDGQAQAQTLATLRDTLLPRLISGQLRLSDAAIEPQPLELPA